jgi:hypothetical protein
VGRTLSRPGSTQRRSSAATGRQLPARARAGRAGDVEAVGDLLGRRAAAGIEPRVTAPLRPLADAVAAGDLRVSTARRRTPRRADCFRSRGHGDAAFVLSRRPSLLFIVWVIVGVAIASSKDYFSNLDTVRAIVSAVLAVLLWPLLLLGIDLHIKP